MRIFVYMRVSTDKQDCQSQKHAIENYLRSYPDAVVTWFEDTGTGTNSKRKSLQELLSRLHECDTLVVYKLDRMFRSTQHMMNLLSTLEKNKVTFVSVKDSIDLSTPAGRLVFQMLSAIAEFEAAVIRERVKDGLRAAKLRGQKLGKARRVFDEVQFSLLRKEGKTLTQCSSLLGVPRSVLHDREKLFVS